MNILKQQSESLVMKNDDIQKLRYNNIVKGSLKIRSKTFETDKGKISYKEDKDYIVDYVNGLVIRKPDSKIPNWADHILCGITDFDHAEYADYSNKQYMVYADYDYLQSEIQRCNNEKTCKISRFIKKAQNGESLRYIVFGDSISAGGEASRDELTFFNRFAKELQKYNKLARIEVINKSIDGENSSEAVKRFKLDVISEKPDLVSIGYGMNDQCKGGIPIDAFYDNIYKITKKIKEDTDADIIIVTPCVSNPLWKYSSGNILGYSEVLKKIGRELGVSVADVYSLWIDELKAGKTHESMLANNINHPNDYGHWIYYKAFLSVL